MNSNWAIVIGINQYSFLPPLKYANHDAELLRDYLGNEAHFDEVWLFSDNSSKIHGESTEPEFAHLNRFLRKQFELPFLKIEDSLWFFFSGHGIRSADQDYLLPSNGDPEEPEKTAISLNFVSERLSRSGAGNIVLIIDACRSEGKHKGQEFGYEGKSWKGIATTIFSCSPQELSWEIDELQHGVFTYTLLQSFRDQTINNPLTIEELESYLQDHVSQLNHKHDKPEQTPHIRCDSVARAKQIFLPFYAAQVSIPNLKKDAQEAEKNADFEKARNSYSQILKASNPGSADFQETLDNLERISGELAIRGYPLPDDLSSELGVDYTLLQDALKRRDWMSADDLMLGVMLEAIGRGKDFGKTPSLNPTVSEIAKFPCLDLRTIDRLWVKYSNRQFGFSIQKRIFVDCGGKLDGECDEKTWIKFGNRVGWRRRTLESLFFKDWIKYGSGIIYDTSAPEGHLPFACIPTRSREYIVDYQGATVSFPYSTDSTDTKERWITLFTRCASCKI